jgi:hypothetical protein
MGGTFLKLLTSNLKKLPSSIMRRVRVESYTRNFPALASVTPTNRPRRFALTILPGLL